jgi:Predicted membrane protein
VNEQDEHAFELRVGRLLRVGVFTAAAICLIGAILMVWRHGGRVVALEHFTAVSGKLSDPASVLRHVRDGSAAALIQLGLFVLIATPVARVVFSLYSYLRQRDLLFVAVTAIVLAVLLISLFQP